MAKQFRELTVCEFLFGPCSKLLLKELATDNPKYWANVEDFIDKNMKNEIGKLSFKQQQWLIKIKTELLEEAFA